MAGRFQVPDALRRAAELARTAPEAAIHRSHHPRLTYVRNAEDPCVGTIGSHA